MNYLKLLISIAFTLFLFVACKQDKESLSRHFHQCAVINQSNKGFRVDLKLPDKVSGERVYLTGVQMKDRVIRAKEGPNEGREEILLASLQFQRQSSAFASKNDMFSYDPQCNILTIYSKASREVIQQTGIASILMDPIEGIDEISFDGGAGHHGQGECYRRFDSCDNQPENVQRNGFFLFHPGHTVGNPLSGYDGIPLKGGN